MNDRFLRACRREETDVTPIWLMRQAGRTLPAYRDLKQRHTFLELTSDAELMTEITLMPLNYFDPDALILFADIMLPLKALGISFDIVEGRGPLVAEPVRTRAQVDRLVMRPMEEAVPSVRAAAALTVEEIGQKLPVIGFAGAPFTLACYLVEGQASREFTQARALMHRDPDTWDALMTLLTDSVIAYLRGQMEAGVHAVQLFDSWVGVVSKSDYSRRILPHTRRIFEELSGGSTVFIHFGTGTSHILEEISSLPIDVAGIDWRIPLDTAWSRIGYGLGIQGNLDPAVLLSDAETIGNRAGEILAAAGERPGHVFNLGHGVLPGTPLANIQFLVDFVHSKGAR